MILKLSKKLLIELTSKRFEHISQNDKDEMAIPSYLHKNPLVRWLMWRRYESISELAKFRKDMTVMEFGCGIGVSLPQLVNACKEVYAIDLFPEYARLLSDKLGLKVTFLPDVQGIPNNHLDIIVAADVLEHIEESDLDEYLLIFRRKLKSNGRLIVSGPTENIVYKIGRVIAGFSKKADYHHRNIDQLIKRISNAGFNLTNLRKLPFKIPPVLFKVCDFKVDKNKDV